MSYADVLDFMAGNLGMSLPDIILLITILGLIVLAAKEIRIALLVGMFLTAGEYVVFSVIGYDAFKALVATMVMLVLLVLSLYISHGKKFGGSIV